MRFSFQISASPSTVIICSDQLEQITEHISTRVLQYTTEQKMGKLRNIKKEYSLSMVCLVHLWLENRYNLYHSRGKMTYSFLFQKKNLLGLIYKFLDSELARKRLFFSERVFLLQYFFPIVVLRKFFALIVFSILVLTNFDC